MKEKNKNAGNENKKPSTFDWEAFRKNQEQVRNDLIAFGEAEGRRLALKEGRAF